MKTLLDTIKEILRQLKATDFKVQKALKLTEREVQIYFTALSTLNEKTGLTFPDLNRVAKKLTNHPSPYISHLKTAKLIEHGQGKGVWLLTERGIEKLQGLLSQQPSPNPQTAPKPEGTVLQLLEKKADKNRKVIVTKPLVAEIARTMGQDDKYVRETIQELLEAKILTPNPHHGHAKAYTIAATTPVTEASAPTKPVRPRLNGVTAKTTLGQLEAKIKVQNNKDDQQIKQLEVQLEEQIGAIKAKIAEIRSVQKRRLTALAELGL